MARCLPKLGVIVKVYSAPLASGCAANVSQIARHGDVGVVVVRISFVFFVFIRSGVSLILLGSVSNGVV